MTSTIAKPDAAAPDQLDGHAPQKQRRRLPIRRILLIAVPIVLLLGGAIAYGMWRDAQHFVATDNAQIAGQPVAIGSMNAGRVTEIDVKVGDAVRRDVVIARVELPSQVGMAQNGQPKLDFLGAADTRVDVSAPFDGVVMSVPTAVGASVAAGQTIASIVDPSQLWVNANIDETSIDRVRVGQLVDVHVDALDADVPGRVEAITPATASSFSPLPTGSSSGTFTKVTQLIPVRIAVNLGNRPALLGTSVEVRVHVGE